MRFTSKSNNVTISAREIIRRASSGNISTYDRGWRDSGMEIILNSHDNNIIQSDDEYDTLVMHVVPFEEISIYHYEDNGKNLIEQPVDIFDMKGKESKALFDFAAGYLMRDEQLAVNM